MSIALQLIHEMPQKPITADEARLLCKESLPGLRDKNFNTAMQLIREAAEKGKDYASMPSADVVDCGDLKARLKVLGFKVIDGGHSDPWIYIEFRV